LSATPASTRHRNLEPINQEIVDLMDSPNSQISQSVCNVVSRMIGCKLCAADVACYLRLISSVVAKRDEMAFASKGSLSVELSRYIGLIAPSFITKSLKGHRPFRVRPDPHMNLVLQFVLSTRRVLQRTLKQVTILCQF